MKLQTTIPLRPVDCQIDYQSQLLLLGSCFVLHIGNKLTYYRFRSVQNPFGVLFHPLAIERVLSKAVRSEYYTEDDLFLYNELWHCFDAHSSLSDPLSEKLLQRLNRGLRNTYNAINRSTHIIITLGTAWVYRRKETGAIVANCHKVPQKEFSKELLTVPEIQACLTRMVSSIRSINGEAQIIFTISPVRHLKEGFVENQRSKAHLISALHNLNPNEAYDQRLQYFPAYEIMMDELRDYRFYEADMVHPNELAVDYIWERFDRIWISPQAKPVMDEVDAVQKGLNHKPFYRTSEQHQRFLETLTEKIKYLQDRYPFMEFHTLPA